MQWIRDELVVIFPPNHPFSLRQEPVLPEEIIGEPVIWHKGVSGIKQYFQQQMSLAGVDLLQIRVAMEVPSTAAVLTSVEAIGIFRYFKAGRPDELAVGLGDRRSVKRYFLE